MKKFETNNIFETNIILITIIALFLSASVVQAQSESELGQRYLKLGNTYMISNELDKAKEFMLKGLKINEKSGNKYWTAASYEYLGYLAFKMGDKEKAAKLLSKALKIYRPIINQKDGSQNAVQQILKKLNELSADTFFPEDQYNAENGAFNYDNLKAKTLDEAGEVPNDAVSVSLRNNKLKNFPSKLTNVNYLRYIDLTNNKIDKIPDDIDKLTNLQYLNLSNNKLKEIPVESLSKMKQLKMLNLQGNKIPFTLLANLIRNLPNTNIQHDEYVLEDQTGTFDFDSYFNE